MFFEIHSPWFSEAWNCLLSVWRWSRAVNDLPGPSSLDIRVSPISVQSLAHWTPLSATVCPPKALTEVKIQSGPVYFIRLAIVSGNITLRVPLPEQRSICKLSRILFLLLRKTVMCPGTALLYFGGSWMRKKQGSAIRGHSEYAVQQRCHSMFLRWRKFLRFRNMT